MTIIQWAREYTPQNDLPVAISLRKYGGGVVHANMRVYLGPSLAKGYDEWEAFFLGEWKNL